MKDKRIEKKENNKLEFEEIKKMDSNDIILVDTKFLYRSLNYFNFKKQYDLINIITNILNNNQNKYFIEPIYSKAYQKDIIKLYEDFDSDMFKPYTFQKYNGLTKSKAFDLLIEGNIKEEKDFLKNENRWILHSIYVGLASRRIAKALNLDENHAEMLGLIHDIGRKIDHNNHPIEGYNYLNKLGYTNVSKICITHNFIDNDINLTAGYGPKDLEKYKFVEIFLLKHPTTIYDNIVQLADLFCLETGFTTIEKRILDITNRKGISENALEHFQKTLELKNRIEKKINCSLYDLFPEVKPIDLIEQENDHQKLMTLLNSKKLIK